MNGKHCSRRKRGMMLISEAMLQIMLAEFSKLKTAKFSTALPASRNSTKHYYK